MSSASVPPFDVLQGGASPYEGFGVPRVATPDEASNLEEALGGARVRVADGFAVALEAGIGAARQLDEIVAAMWGDGWSPVIGDVNLFVTDFGLILFGLLQHHGGGAVVMRKEGDPSHLSIWWKDARVEAFPFHCMLKCLTTQGEASADSFVRGVLGLLAV